MTDYMKEAERLADAYAVAYMDFVRCGKSCHEETRAALLAHLQRGAVPEGWQLVPKEPTPEMLAGGWGYWLNVMAPGKQRDTAAKEYTAMLAAAPVPDHFRDAAEMVAEPADDRIASAIHYPECWDTAAYPTVESALSEVFAHYRCTEHDAPGEVPMPEQDGWFCWAGSERGHSPFFSGYEPLAHSERERAFTQTKMRTYGAACRAAGEAAGYARGLAEAGRDAERYRTVRFLATAERDPLPEYAGDTSSPDAFDASIDHATAALRGEVK